MTETLQAVVDELTAQFSQIEKTMALSYWEAATTGTEEALNASAEAHAALMRFFADPTRYEQFKVWDESGAAGDDAHLRRIVRVAHLGFAQGQRDPATIEEVAELSKALDEAHTNFRAEVDSERLSANDIVTILRKENDSAKRQKVWEASKEIGPRIADQIRRLAELRNDAAQRMGYANFHRMSLELGEIDPDWLFAALDDLYEKMDDAYRAAKAELDAQLAERFGVSADAIMPWHYAEPFFQEAPMIGEYDFDAVFDGQDLEALAVATYDSMGMDVRDILARSDLYERENKDQHAFCMDMNREGDVRTLCNLKPTLRWMETLLHELGHAVYNKYIPRELPYLLRDIPHTLTTEAMAMLMGAETLDPAWHTLILGAAETDAAAIGAAGQARFRLNELIFARWVMVVVNFERLLYEDPSRDLQAAWWELVSKYQNVNVPPGRENKQDWAAKYHVSLAPAYYQNYLLGRMMSLQWDGWLRSKAGGITGHAAAGDFFREKVFKLGNTLHWNDALEVATGEKLNPAYFVQKFVQA